jgi:hypothetical protein
LGRQTKSGHLSAEPARAPRLDQLTLPVRFTAIDAGADGHVRSIEICRERVLVRRSVRGMAIRFNLPHQAFRGVSLRFAPTEGCVVALEHDDPGLSITLASGEDETALFAQWEAWSQALSLPLMIGNDDGALCVVGSRPGETAKPAPRRRKHNAVRGRRPTILMRRKVGQVARALPVFSEREIIARR